MKFYPGDAGRYITAGIVFARLDGVENASIHRMLVLDERRVVARLVEGRHTHGMLMAALDRGEKLPVAVAIGVHPAVTFASTTRVRPGWSSPSRPSPWGAGSGCRGAGMVSLSPRPRSSWKVSSGVSGHGKGPSWTSPGPMTRCARSRSSSSRVCRQRRTSSTRASSPAGTSTRCSWGSPYEPIIYRAVSAVTKVRNVHLTRGGCGYLHAVIQIRKATQGDGKNAILAAFAAHTSLKHVVVVDEDIDPDRYARRGVRGSHPGEGRPGHPGHHRCPGLVPGPLPARRRDEREGGGGRDHGDGGGGAVPAGGVVVRDGTHPGGGEDLSRAGRARPAGG